jgi:hypothetical protein
MGMIRDVLNIEVPDANAQADAGTCNCNNRQTLFAEGDGTMVTTSGENSWVDLPRMRVDFEVSASSNVDILSLVPIINGPADCRIRFVLDSLPIGSLPEATGAVAPITDNSRFPYVLQLTGMRRAMVNSGRHSIQVQIAKSAGLFQTGGNCQVQGNLMRLRVDVEATR